MALVRSSAWASSSAEATDVYWVYAQQVSKQAETGEYLSLGGFMIRGIKNFVGIHSLEIGLGILFRALPSSDSRPSVCNDAEEAKEGDSFLPAIPGTLSRDHHPQDLTDCRLRHAEEEDSMQMHEHNEKEEVEWEKGGGQGVAETDNMSSRAAELDEVVESDLDRHNEEVEGDIDRHKKSSAQLVEDGEQGDDEEDGLVQVTGLEGVSEILTKAPQDGSGALLEAVAMVGPISALRECRYVVAIRPGKQSRSTLISDALKHFMASGTRGKKAPAISTNTANRKEGLDCNNLNSNTRLQQSLQPQAPARQTEIDLVRNLMKKDTHLVLPHVPSNGRVVRLPAEFARKTK